MPGSVMRSLLLFLLVLALGGTATACRWLQPAVQVHVKNGTGFPMRDTQLKIRGEQVSIGTVRPAEDRSARLRPCGETGLSLEFTDPTGHACQKDLDVYLDNGYAGRVDVLVLGCHSAKVKDLTKIWPRAGETLTFANLRGLG
jgi:hypothetical protein